MRKFLIDEKQVFGMVRNETPNGGQGRPPETLNKPLGSTSVRMNEGHNHGPSFADKNPNAYAQACAHTKDILTAWTGKPKGAA